MILESILNMTDPSLSSLLYSKDEMPFENEAGTETPKRKSVNSVEKKVGWYNPDLSPFDPKQPTTMKLLILLSLVILAVLLYFLVGVSFHPTVAVLQTVPRREGTHPAHRSRTETHGSHCDFLMSYCVSRCESGLAGNEWLGDYFAAVVVCWVFNVGFLYHFGLYQSLNLWHILFKAID